MNFRVFGGSIFFVGLIAFVFAVGMIKLSQPKDMSEAQFNRSNLPGLYGSYQQFKRVLPDIQSAYWTCLLSARIRVCSQSGFIRYYTWAGMGLMLLGFIFFISARRRG